MTQLDSSVGPAYSLSLTAEKGGRLGKARRLGPMFAPMMLAALALLPVLRSKEGFSTGVLLLLKFRTCRAWFRSMLRRFLTKSGDETTCRLRGGRSLGKGTAPKPKPDSQSDTTTTYMYHYRYSIDIGPIDIGPVLYKCCEMRRRGTTGREEGGHSDTRLLHQYDF